MEHIENVGHMENADSDNPRNVTRHELKYYIGYSDYIVLRDILSKIMKPDLHNKTDNPDKSFEPARKGYFIRSLYFDTKHDISYSEKLGGFENRNKFRIRIYGFDSGKAKCEIKSKFNDQIMKETAIIDRKDVPNIVAGEYECLLRYKSKTLNKVYYRFVSDYFRPVVLVDYYREAYHYDINNIRLTFDRFLAKNDTEPELYDRELPMTPVFGKHKMILEVKYDNQLPSWIRSNLKLKAFERCAISKYCHARAI